MGATLTKVFLFTIVDSVAYGAVMGALEGWMRGGEVPDFSGSEPEEWVFLAKIGVGAAAGAIVGVMRAGGPPRLPED